MEFIFCLGKWKNRGRHHYRNTKYAQLFGRCDMEIFLVKRLNTKLETTKIVKTTE